MLLRHFTRQQIWLLLILYLLLLLLSFYLKHQVVLKLWWDSFYSHYSNELSGLYVAKPMSFCNNKQQVYCLAQAHQNQTGLLDPSSSSVSRSIAQGSSAGDVLQNCTPLIRHLQTRWPSTTGLSPVCSSPTCSAPLSYGKERKLARTLVPGSRTNHNRLQTLQLV